MMAKSALSVVVQAGGQSRRMGRDKALVGLGNRPMIAHVLSRVAPLADEIVITSNNRAELTPFGYRVVADEEPGAGALPGLWTALRAAAHEIVLLVACDMPFVSAELLQVQIDRLGSADVVVPRWQNRFQPMHAVYRRQVCLAAVERALQAGQKRMISWFDQVELVVLPEDEVAAIDPRGDSFFNVNTPEELALAERMLAEREP